MNLALALLSALFLVLVCPSFSLVWLAPVALTPLLIAMGREPSWRRRLLYGWAAGVVYWFGVCYWIQFVLEVHGGMGRWGGWGTFLIFAVAKAAHLAVFSLLAGWLISKPWAVPAVAALWAGMERTHGPLGFAWLMLGNAGIDMEAPLRLAPYVGVYGLSFLFTMIAAVAALIVLRRSWRQLAWLLVLPSLYLLPQLAETPRATASAVAVQPNIPDIEQWTYDLLTKTTQRLTTMSLETAREPGQPPARLILWPEVPAPFYYESDPEFREQMNTLARLAQAYVLFGEVAYTKDGHPLNSALFLSPAGEPIDRYDKIFLVPFGEFVPRLFSFVNRITKEAGDFVPGTRIVVFPFGEHRLGAFICYESAFPHLVRQFALRGAQVLVNLSNDGYFGHSAARLQHLSLVRMRAAENRRWILRATNDGYTVSINPAGRIVASLPPYREFAGRLPYGFVDSLTPYTRYGDWFAWACLVAGLACAALSWRVSNRR